MAILNLALLVLLGTALLFSVIELGISAYVVSNSRYYYTDYDPVTGRFSYGTRHVSPPGEISFLLFNSLWTILVTGALLAIPFMWAKNRAGAQAKERWFAPLTLGLFALTMIFWLAGFAALSNRFMGWWWSGLPAALLAFAILLWLIFVALLIITVLTSLSVLKVDRPGHSPIFKRRNNLTSQPEPIAAPATTEMPKV